MRGSPLAVPLERRAKALFSELAEEFPDDIHYREHAGRADHNLGVMARLAGQYVVAHKHFEDAIDAFARITDDKNVPPREGWYQGFHAEALIQIATVNAAIGDIQDAVCVARQSVDISESLVRKFPGRPEYAERLARATRVLSQQLLAAGQPQDAVEACRRQISLFEEMGRLPQVTSKPTLASAHLALAFVLIKIGALNEANQEWDTATSDKFTLDSGALIAFAWDLAAPHDVEPTVAAMALKAALRANQLMPHDAMILSALGVAYYRAGNWAEAIESFVKAEAMSAEKSLAINGFFLAMAHSQLGHKEEARIWYDRSVTRMETHQPKDDDLIRFRTEAAELLGLPKSDDAPKHDSPAAAPPR
jgi:tetratricopeptide (TPR) repeat protein